MGVTSKKIENANNQISENIRSNLTAAKSSVLFVLHLPSLKPAEEAVLRQNLSLQVPPVRLTAQVLAEAVPGGTALAEEGEIVQALEENSDCTAKPG